MEKSEQTTENYSLQMALCLLRYIIIRKEKLKSIVVHNIMEKFSMV